MIFEILWQSPAGATVPWSGGNPEELNMFSISKKWQNYLQMKPELV